MLAQVADDWPLRPIQVDAAELGAFGGFEGWGVGWFEEGVGAGVAGDDAGAGIDLGGLPGGGGFEDGVPAPGVDGVGFEGNANGRGGGDAGGIGEILGFGVLGPALAPEDDHAG